VPRRELASQAIRATNLLLPRRSSVGKNARNGLTRQYTIGLEVTVLRVAVRLAGSKIEPGDLSHRLGSAGA